MEKQVNQEIDIGNFQVKINSRIQSQAGVTYRVGRGVGKVRSRVNSSTNFIGAELLFAICCFSFVWGLPASWAEDRALNFWIFFSRAAEMFFYVLTNLLV